MIKLINDDDNTDIIEKVYEHKFNELYVYNISNIDYSKYIVNKDKNDDSMYKIYRNKILHKIESIKIFFKQYIVNMRKYLDIADTESEEFNEEDMTAYIFIDRKDKKMKNIEKECEKYISIGKEIYDLIHCIDHYHDYFTIFTSALFIDKKYYNKHIGEYKSIEDLILNIPIKHFRLVLKTFDEIYMKNYLRDKNIDEEVLRYNYLDIYYNKYKCDYMDVIDSNISIMLKEYKQ